MKKYEDILRDALHEIKEEELNRLPLEEEIDHEFSKRFTDKTQNLIRNHNKYYSEKSFKRIILAVLIAILMLIITLSATASQDKILNFIYRIYSEVVYINLGDSEKTETDVEHYKYTLCTVPDGYEYRGSRGYSSSISLWINPEDNSRIELSQSTATKALQLNTYGNDVEEFTVNSVYVMCVKQEINYQYTWETNGYLFVLSYPIELGKDFAAQNIGKLEKANTENE